MNNIFTLTTLLFLITHNGSGQHDNLNYFLPDGMEYNQNIPTPMSVVGHEIGEWHISHDRLVSYMYALAGASDRIQITEYARSFETRPLLVLTITSPKNHANIDQIKKQHVQLTNPEVADQLNIKNMPAVVYMGYSVHGNEPSGSNASLLVAYHLAAAQDPTVEKMLEETIILLDPSLNPDGLQRFSGWVNSRKSKQLVADPNNIEQNEGWPGGRTNHYWFDLNRDWLPVQLPESRGRIALFHEWKPNVLTDHHEMGTNSTFFFQPGIPSRNNPLTPENTYTLTNKMGEYHAKALDGIGSLYYTKESFDDYYYGKGSTYPDIHGAVGILFEQASSRSHAQESHHGILRFPFTIKNQFTTSLSTLQAVSEMREDFLSHQRTFYKNSVREAQTDANKAFIFGSKDKYRNYHLAELISRHEIDVYHTAQPITLEGTRYQPDEAFVIPLQQTQYRLLKAMFEKRTEFQDSLFYDVSTWTLPLAFGVDYRSLDEKSFNNALLGAPFDAKEKPMGKVIGGKSSYAYAFEWHGYYTPKILNRLLEEDYIAKVANEPFHTAEGKRFERGSILLPVAIQDKSADSIHTQLITLAKEGGVDIHALSTGLDYEGVSLGSPSFSHLKKPEVMMLIEGGVSEYDAGEVWHLLDQRYEMKVSLLSINLFNRADISKYNTLIMVDGRYNNLSDAAKEKLKLWVKDGGTIIASQKAVQYISAIGIGKFNFENPSHDPSLPSAKYADISASKGAQRIGGAIFNTRVDNTHPLLYGYYKTHLPIFRNSQIFMEKSKNPFANPVVYTSTPLLSGYISAPNLDQLKGTSAVGISNYGRGQVIGFTDNLNFRAFWYGTNKLFANAIFFGPVIRHEAGL